MLFWFIDSQSRNLILKKDKPILFIEYICRLFKFHHQWNNMHVIQFNSIQFNHDNLCQVCLKLLNYYKIESNNQKLLELKKRALGEQKKVQESHGEKVKKKAIKPHCL